MSQGILERIEAKLDALSLAIGTPVVATLESTVDESGLAPLKSAPAAPAADVELDTDGVPWDERIHSSNQKRSKAGKGAWMKKKGGDKDEYTRITAELKAQYSQVDLSNDEPTETKSAPPPPAAGKSAPPPPAAGKSAPPPPATESDSRRSAVEAINVLTTKHSINYDAVVSYFLGNYNVATFEEIPNAKFEFVTEDCVAWADSLDAIATQIAEIKQVYINDISVIEPYIKDCWAGCTLDGADCEDYTDVAFDDLEPVQTKINALFESLK